MQDALLHAEPELAHWGQQHPFLHDVENPDLEEILEKTMWQFK